MTPVLAFALGLLFSAMYFHHVYRPRIHAGRQLVENILARNPNVQNSVMVMKSFSQGPTLIGYVLAKKTVPNQPIGVLYTDASGQYLIDPSTTWMASGGTLQQ